MTLLVGRHLVTVVFVFVERRSSEPVLAPRLFANRVFSSASAIGFVVGFAMFGALIFLPLYFQDVRGVTPTIRDLRLLPMMAGLFLTSITTGQLVSRGWKYRPFPIVGTVVMTIGLFLLGTVTDTTSSSMIALYMLVLGMGIGLVMQVLVTAVQNAVDTSDIGAATAGANFFRSIGGCVRHRGLRRALRRIVAAPVGHWFRRSRRHSTMPSRAVDAATCCTPSREPTLVVLHAISASIAEVYRCAIPIGVLAIMLSLTLPEVKLRTSLHPVADEIPMSNADPLV